jgi:predicted  nucleic acid-binding Zn-ribbon protein
VSPELSQLVELQELDHEIQRVTDRLASIPVERDQIESTFRQYAAEFLDLKARYEQALSERKQLEADLIQAQETNEKYKNDLMRVRNEKEYITALREIDATKKQIGVLETEILKRMEEIEQLESQLSVNAPEIEQKRGEVDKDLALLSAEHQSIEGRVEALRLRRKELSQSIPAQLLAVYERVARIRRGQALSEVRNGACSACRMRVRPKVFSDVRKGDQLIVCDNCSRIFYYRPDVTESAEAAIS